MLSTNQQEKIAHEVIRVLYTSHLDSQFINSYIYSSPFHKTFLNMANSKVHDNLDEISQYAKIVAWINGITDESMKSFYTQLMEILSDGIRRDFHSLFISRKQQDIIFKTIIQLNHGINNSVYPFEEDEPFLHDGIYNIPIRFLSIDCCIEDNNEIKLFDIVSSNPVSINYEEKKEKLLCLKAGLGNKYPEKNISFHLGFPYASFFSGAKDNDKKNFIKNVPVCSKYFNSTELLYSDEFWDYLAEDKSTTLQISMIIEAIATLDFIEKYDFINDSQNRVRNRNQTLKILQDWSLYFDAEMLKNNTKIINRIAGDNRCMRRYNQPLFSSGNYNIERQEFFRGLQLFGR